MGAKFNGKIIGSHSDYVCFSFQAIKHLTTGDGGALTCKTEQEYERIKKLRWFGLNRKYNGPKWEQDVTESVFKYHMNNINAVIGIESMKNIDEIIGKHIKNGKYYDLKINNPNIKKIRRSENIESSYWIYTVLTEDREKFKKYMLDNGVEADVVHIRNDKYSVFNKYKINNLPGCDYFCSKMINIPVGWWLTEKEIEYIVNLINAY